MADVVGALLDEEEVRRLEELGALRRDFGDLGLLLRDESTRPSTVWGAVEVEAMEDSEFDSGEAGERGYLKTDIGFDHIRLKDGRGASGVWGVVGQPWI